MNMDFKKVTLIGALLVLMFANINTAKADIVSSVTNGTSQIAQDVIFTLQNQINNLKLQLLTLQLNNLKQQLPAALSTTNTTGTTTSPSNTTQTLTLTTGPGAFCNFQYQQCVVGGSDSKTACVSNADCVAPAPAPGGMDTSSSTSTTTPTTTQTPTTATTTTPTTTNTSNTSTTTPEFSSIAQQISLLQTTLDSLTPEDRKITITIISPESVPVDEPDDVFLTIYGTNFIDGDKVSMNKSTGTGVASPTFLKTQFLPATLTAGARLLVTIPKKNLKKSGDYNIVVWDKDPDLPSSKPVTFNVAPIVITSISPDSVILPISSDVTLTVNGTGFTKSSQILAYISGTPITTFISSTQLKIILPIFFINDFADKGNSAFGIAVVNVLGGEASNRIEFGINKTLLKIVKNTIGNIGPVDFGYNINGPTSLGVNIGLDKGAFNRLGNSDFNRLGNQDSAEEEIEVKPGTYSITELPLSGWTFNSALCDRNYKAGADSAAEVTNIEVIAGKTTECTFTNTKNNPDLTVSEITPSEVMAGSPDTKVTIEGTKFNDNSYVQLMSKPRFGDYGKFIPNFISTTKLEILVPKKTISDPVNLLLGVINPKTENVGEEKSNLISFSVVEELNTDNNLQNTSTITPTLNTIAMKTLQEFLINNGYSIPAGATGYYGDQTKSAVGKFQIANGLSVTSPYLGIIGPWTRAIIKEKYGVVINSQF